MIPERLTTNELMDVLEELRVHIRDCEVEHLFVSINKRFDDTNFDVQVECFCKYKEFNYGVGLPEPTQ